METDRDCPACLILRRAWYAASTQMTANTRPSAEQIAAIAQERETNEYQAALAALREHLASHRRESER